LDFLSGQPWPNMSKPSCGPIAGLTPIPAPKGQAEAPASPCVQICALDSAGICIGCGRSLDEITRWARASAAARRGILHAARERMAFRQSSPSAAP